MSKRCSRQRGLGQGRFAAAHVKDPDIHSMHNLFHMLWGGDLDLRYI